MLVHIEPNKIKVVEVAVKYARDRKDKPALALTRTGLIYGSGVAMAWIPWSQLGHLIELHQTETTCPDPAQFLEDLRARGLSMRANGMGLRFGHAAVEPDAETGRVDILRVDPLQPADQQYSEASRVPSIKQYLGIPPRALESMLARHHHASDRSTIVDAGHAAIDENLLQGLLDPLRMLAKAQTGKHWTLPIRLVQFGQAERSTVGVLARIDDRYRMQAYIAQMQGPSLDPGWQDKPVEDRWI